MHGEEITIWDSQVLTGRIRPFLVSGLHYLARCSPDSIVALFYAQLKSEPSTLRDSSLARQAMEVNRIDSGFLPVRAKDYECLHIVIHRKLVRVWAKAEGVVFLLLHLDPVRDEVGIEDVAFEQERMIGFECFDRAAE